MSKEESSYREYRKNLIESEKRKDYFNEGKWAMAAGIVLLLCGLYLLPLRAEQAGELCGNELKNRSVCYIDKLEILHTKTDEKSDGIYGVAKFYDKEQNGWIVSFTPGKGEVLKKRIQPELEISGYFYMEKISGKEVSFYSVFGKKYADAEGLNMLELNAEYLCGEHENYMPRLFMRPGYLLSGFLFGIIGLTKGAILMIRNKEKRNKSEKNTGGFRK